MPRVDIQADRRAQRLLSERPGLSRRRRHSENYAAPASYRCLRSDLLETTFLGAYYGQIWQRAPQMRLGFVQKLPGSRDFKFSPEVAIMMPLEGLPPAGCGSTTVALFDHRPADNRSLSGLRLA